MPNSTVEPSSISAEMYSAIWRVVSVTAGGGTKTERIDGLSFLSMVLDADLRIVSANTAFYQLFKSIPTDTEPGCRVRGVSNLHPVGTCRMGPGPNAVVDDKLKVHGLEGLRVADASISRVWPNRLLIRIEERAPVATIDDAIAGDGDRAIVAVDSNAYESEALDFVRYDRGGHA